MPTTELDPDTIDARNLTYAGKHTFSERSDDKADGVYGGMNSSRAFAEAGISPGDVVTLYIETVDGGDELALRRHTHGASEGITLPMQYRRELDLSPGDTVHWWLGPADAGARASATREPDTAATPTTTQPDLTESFEAAGDGGATARPAPGGEPSPTDRVDAIIDAHRRLLNTVEEIETEYGTELAANVLKTVTATYGAANPDVEDDD